jgi:hypothetical protein
MQMTSALLILALLAPPSVEAAARFTAVPDSIEITQDDSVSVKFHVETESLGAMGGLQFSAPDFELVNEYTSQFVNSVLGGDGRIGIRNTRDLTKVFRPRRTGELKITGISIQAEGQVLRAPDIVIKVRAGGAGTPPPKRYGGGGSGGLRGAGKQGRAEPFFIRAEIDKQKLVKGEQLIVSYYIYRSTRVFNIAVEKYPTLNGFLREDLEMPVLGQRLDSEPVVLDGVPYYRSLLVRYAAYPLQEGKLPIDTMSVKGAYYLQQGGNPFDDEEDLFTGFFQRMAPQERSMRSEIVNVEVEPLPAPGKPASFTGGVGDFEVTSAVDKTQLRAHEAVTLTVKVEGKGNTSSIEAPKHPWPPGLELYESKGQARSGRGGVGEKVFEYLLIPRVPGQMRIPALEFSFFDPKKRSYVTKQTQPADIQVLPGDPAAAPQSPRSDGGTGIADSPNAVEPMGLLGPEDYKGSTFGATLRRGAASLKSLGWLGLLLALGAALREALLRWKPRWMSQKRTRKAPSLDRMKAEAKELAASGSADKIRDFCDRLEDEVFRLIDDAFQLGARALPREELRRQLTEERSVDSATWLKIAEILEFTEAARYSSREPDAQFRAQLARQVGDLQMVSGRVSQILQKR